ncbi:hypothetical protein RN001_001363 [Aquatica leii]|uniref:EndoU domain-containing protein n=1 Tax=Aquatica leii TaxID=1421715 RepID=A0AAN7SJJ3_9COLE|nr:hypothetical protein RN001_001363 [Aquatica leii]
MTFISCVFIILTVIIYDITCLDSTFSGHNNNSWSFETQHSTWFNSSSSLNQLPFNENARAIPFNLSQNAWPPIRAPQPLQPDSTWIPNNRRHRPKNNTINNMSNFHSLGPNKKNDNKTNQATYTVEDNELREFSEELLRIDTNNAARYVTANFQGKTTSSSKEDKAPLPLLALQSNVNQIPTISKLKRLHDNYIVYVDQNEQVTSGERQEEDDMLNAFLSTQVMEYTRNFLVEKGRITNDPAEFKAILKEIWFTLYSRSKGRLGSSGFEHIFLGEIRNTEVTGFHNWVYFNNQEINNNVDYLGYLKIVTLGNKGYILKHHFKFHGADKPVDSMFIGTSPELEMALYSTCFLLRPDQICPLQLAGKNFIVRAFTFNYNGKKLIGSAFPEI